MDYLDLFKYGVTPKDGDGQKLTVLRIEESGVVALDEFSKEHRLKHGTYELWRPPKTLFNDPHVKPTWGNLKKAMEAAGMLDDAVFVHEDTILPANWAVFNLSTDRKAVIVTQ